MWRSLVEKWWRPVVGLILGLATSVAVRQLVPYMGIGRDTISSVVTSTGFGDPTKVLDVVEWIVHTTWGVLLPVAASGLVFELVFFIRGAKRASRLGLKVGLLWTLPLLALMLLLVFTKGMTYPLDVWLVRALLLPPVAMLTGMIGALLGAGIVGSYYAIRRRSRSTL